MTRLVAGARAVADHCARVGIDADGRADPQRGVLSRRPPARRATARERRHPDTGSVRTGVGGDPLLRVRSRAQPRRALHVPPLGVRDRARRGDPAARSGRPRRPAGRRDQVRAVRRAVQLLGQDQPRCRACHRVARAVAQRRHRADRAGQHRRCSSATCRCPTWGWSGAKLLFGDGTLQHGGHVYSGQPNHVCVGWRGRLAGSRAVAAARRRTRVQWCHRRLRAGTEERRSRRSAGFPSSCR